jgi:hypothetical protein
MTCSPGNFSVDMRVRHQDTDDEEEPVSTTNYGVLGPSDAQRLKRLEGEKRRLNRRVQGPVVGIRAGIRANLRCGIEPAGQEGKANEQAAAGLRCQLGA